MIHVVGSLHVQSSGVTAWLVLMSKHTALQRGVCERFEDQALRVLTRGQIHQVSMHPLHACAHVCMHVNQKSWKSTGKHAKLVKPHYINFHF